MEMLILDRELKLKQITSVDKLIPIIDIVSPQKSSFKVTADIADIADITDIVVLKNGFNVSYIGVIQDKEIDAAATIYTYPLINITDNDCLMQSVNGSVFDWVVQTFTQNFINTSDDYFKIPFEFTDGTGGQTLQYELADGNLFEALLKIFLISGCYLDFSLTFLNGKPNKIIANVARASNFNKITIRYDNPIMIKKPIIELSQNQSANKIIYKPSADNTAHTDIVNYYLLDTNEITTNASAEGRIKGVVQKIVEYTDEEFAALPQHAAQALLGDAYSHKIVLTMVKNSSYNFKIYDLVVFIDKNRTYTTFATRVENIDDNYIIVTLGILRTTLTDRFKQLARK